MKKFLLFGAGALLSWTEPLSSSLHFGSDHPVTAINKHRIGLAPDFELGAGDFARDAEEPIGQLLPRIAATRRRRGWACRLYGDLLGHCS
jgi:hypothetical protein